MFSRPTGAQSAEAMNRPGRPEPRATVFVVDGDLGDRSAAARVAGSLGFAVEAYRSADEFLLRFDPARPGCVVSELVLPGLSGLDLLDRLRAIGWEIPVLFVTADGDVGSAVRALKTGAFDFLEKPVAEQDLREHLTRAVAQDAFTRGHRAERLRVERRLALLTRREREVTALVLEGKTSREIAASFGISVRTVEIHRSKLMQKLGAHSVSHLVRLCMP